MEMSSSDPNSTRSDSFHHIYIVCFPLCGNELHSTLGIVEHPVNNHSLAEDWFDVHQDAHSTFRMKHYGDVHRRGLEIACQERYTH